MKSIAIIVAGGAGSRLPGPRPKQFLEIAGRPLLAYTVERFDRCRHVDGVVLVLPKEGFEDCCALMAPWVERSKVTAFVPGGPERQDSVAEGLAAVPAAFEDVVLVHDGARPLVTDEIISSVVGEAERSGAAIVALPVQDTIKEVDGYRLVVGTVDRERLYRAQTPQAFRATILREALSRARREGFRGTDESALVERIGVKVSLVAGSERNIKVTTAEDLAIVEQYLKREER